MKTIEEFKESLVNEIEAYLPKGPKYSISCTQVQKNNGYQEALIIKEEGKNIAPTLYINALYSEYLRNENMDAIMQHVSELYQREIPFQINSANDILEKPVFVTIVNKETNAELLSNCPHLEYGDLALIAKLQVLDDGTVTVTKSLLDEMKLSVDELFDKAIYYTKENMGPLVTPIGDKLLGVRDTECKMSSSEELANLDSSELMFIISNDSLLYGGATLIFQDQIDNLATVLGGDIYLLPSSVHELICVSAESTQQEQLLEMVKEINRTEVSREDFLSNSIYRYETATKKLTAITQEGREINMELKGTKKELENKPKKKHHR